jgi:hypothetical protein
MNWDAVSGIAEAVGAIGVIASLLYVGYQIRENTVAAQRTNARQSASDHARALLGVQDDVVSDIVFRGIDDLNSLTPLELYRFDLAITVWLEAIEQAHLDFENNSFPTDQYKVFRNRIPGVLNTVGGRAW